MSDYNDANAMKVRRLNRILGELFDAADAVVLTCRAILYVGSVAMAWFYLHDKVLAIALIISLSIAHGLISLREWVARKKKEAIEA